MIPSSQLVKSSKLSVGKWVQVRWEESEQRSWYGCPEGKVVEYDDTRRLYAVEHYDSEIPYRLYYSREELAASLWEKIILKLQEARER